MELAEEIAAIAQVVAAFAEDGEILTGIVAAEPAAGRRLYVCSYERGGARSWLAVDAAGTPLRQPQAVREAVSIAALCELAEETAGGGDVEQLLVRIEELRERDPSLDLERARAAALRLAAVIEPPPRAASPTYLDRVGAAARELEQALGNSASSPFALALQQGMPAVEALVADVERGHKQPLHEPGGESWALDHAENRAGGRASPSQ